MDDGSGRRVGDVHNRQTAAAIGHRQAVGGRGAGHTTGRPRCVDLSNDNRVAVVEGVEEGDAGAGVGHGHDVVEGADIDGCAGGIHRSDQPGLRRQILQWIGSLV